MRRLSLLLGPLLLLAAGVASALAGDAATAPPPAPAPTMDYLLTLGPYGALVWGAYLVGRGMKVTIQIELSEHDRELIEKLAKGAG